MSRVKVLMVTTLMLVAARADAASLKICYAAVPADTVRVEALAGAAVLYQDLVPGSVTTSGVTCSTNSLPASFVRGMPQSITLRGYNSFSEVGPASNALDFRAPLVPPVVTGVTVAGVAGP